jgi:hypothetical protein
MKKRKKNVATQHHNNLPSGTRIIAFLKLAFPPSTQNYNQLQLHPTGGATFRGGRDWQGGKRRARPATAARGQVRLRLPTLRIRHTCLPKSLQTIRRVGCRHNNKEQTFTASSADVQTWTDGARHDSTGKGFATYTSWSASTSWTFE